MLYNNYVQELNAIINTLNFIYSDKKSYEKISFKDGCLYTKKDIVEICTQELDNAYADIIKEYKNIVHKKYEKITYDNDTCNNENK